MSSFKTFFQHFFQSSCKASREKLVQKWQMISAMRGGGVCSRFFRDQVEMLNTFSQHCSAIAAHRARRTLQIMQLYKKLYGNKSAEQLLLRLQELLKHNPKNKMALLLGAAFFDWNKNRITERDLETVENDLRPFFDCTVSDATYKDEEGEVWEKVLDKDNFKLWRCPVKGSSLYKYRVYGTFKDIPAIAFFNIQLDLEYRKQWDNHVIQLEQIDQDDQSGTEVIYWATHFPLGFLYDRDYVFARKIKVDAEKKTMTLTNESVHHPSFPETKKFVRVAEYSSQMMIRPHTQFNENGFDYVMSYQDNPHLSIPNWVVNKLTMQSLPAFLEQLHTATRNLLKSKVELHGYIPCPPVSPPSTDNVTATTTPPTPSPPATTSRPMASTRTTSTTSKSFYNPETISVTG